MIHLVLALLRFTGPTGFEIDINPVEVSSVREPRAAPEGHYGKGTNCLLVMNNGKFIAVHETCDEARGKLTQGPCTEVCGGTR